MGISISKVVSEDHEEVASLISLIVLLLMVDPVFQLSKFCFEIIGLHGGVVDNGVYIVVHRVEIEALRRAIVLVEGMGKDLSAFSFMLEEGSPYPFHFCLIKSALLILII